MLASLVRKSTLVKPPPVRSFSIPFITPWRQQHYFIHQRSDKWLPWEDDLLRNYVKHNGKKWNEFVQHCLPNRSPSQCQSRWTDVLNPALRRGPFSPIEKGLLEKGVSTLGPGQWAKISEQYLPQRSPRRIANEWSGTSTNQKWNEEEDELVMKGIAQFGQAWTKIATHYLPWRNRIQIRNHYRSQLDPNVKKEKWTEHELDLLLRRTIIFGQDWNKVAEGLPGRTPEKCSTVWMTELDPALNKGPWSNEETRLFWERVHQFRGNFVKVAEGLPGRNRLICFRKFWSTVRHDREFTLLYGDALKKEKSENGPMWRARVAQIVCDWLNQETSIRQSSNQSIDVHQAGPWNEQDLLKLDKLVNKQLEKKGVESIEYGDWKKISKQFLGRDVHQCKYQYDEHLSIKNISKGTWTKEEDYLLSKLVKEHGTTHWDKIVKQIPNRNKRQCAYRWHRVLQFNSNDDETTKQPVIKNKRLSDTEKSLIREGVQMFGPNWTAIRMTYLPTRTPEQIMRWWNFQKQTNLDDGDSNSSRKSFWTEDEDKALQFAVNKYKNEVGEVPSWAEVSKMIQGRTPKQCRTRWLYTLEPNVKKGTWTYEEEMQLLETVQKLKFQNGKSSKKSMWPLVAKELNTGRSDWACRSKYDYMQRKGHRFAF